MDSLSKWSGIIRAMPASLACMLLLAASLPAQAITLDRIVSREDPKFDVAKARLTVGLDGSIYLSSSAKNAGYILRVSLDGKQKQGGNAIYSMGNATANAEGVIASSNSHFNHSVNVYSASFKQIAVCNKFLGNDKVGWDSPARVEAGESGDFYGLDKHRNRILRIDPSGRVVKAYALAGIKAVDFRVSEATETFVLRGPDNTLRGVNFDQKATWTRKQPGLFTMDAAGRVYVLDKDTLTVLKPDELEPGEVVEASKAISLPASKIVGASSLGVLGDNLLIKRADPVELFQVYSLADGTLRHAVFSDHVRVKVEFPSLVWTAGEAIPFSSPIGSRIWVTTLGDTDWRELPLEGEPSAAVPAAPDGSSQSSIRVPADFAGLYHLRIAPTINPQAASEFTLQGAVEVRAPDSQGTVSLWTPLNRIWFGRGEPIPVSVSVRTTQKMPETITVSLVHRDPSPRQGRPVEAAAAGGGRDLSVTQVTLDADSTATLTIPSSVTAQLAPGRYELRTSVPGFTCVPQPVRIGAGLAARSPFRVTQHGDYGNFASEGSIWEFADTADSMLNSTQSLGLNQIVNRTFAGRYPLTFANTADGIPLQRDLEKRLAADPNGVAPQKVAFGSPHAHALGAWGAHGIREMLILVGMDAALPIGTSMPWQAGVKPEGYAAEIRRYTEPLLGLPGFAGWDWVANWWTVEDKKFESPEQKAAYAAALKQANETGSWDPVLETVGDRAINWQPEAQEMFHKALAEISSSLTTASAGPYRRPEIYPPVTFANVDEVDLHFQAEQITCPNWTAHATDFYKRPGKPAWIHPELWNDTGTGEQILPMSWLGIMRGVDGIGKSGPTPHWGPLPTDSRSGYPGTQSVHRALNEFAREYGPWLTTLENNDRVGIVVSRRQIKADAWGGIGGRYFTRLWEAHMNCLYARVPATFLFPEDTPDLSRFKAVLVVGQRYEIEPPLAALLTQARQQGIPIFADASCRESLVQDFAPLGVAFDAIEKLHGFNNDVAWWDFPKALLATAPSIAAKLSPLVPPVAAVDQPEVLVSERRNGESRFVWVVNNTSASLDPGLLWRVQQAVATRLPVVANVRLPIQEGEVVYDVFAGDEVPTQKPEVSLVSDLRFSHGRLYAVLPRAIESLDLKAPDAFSPGQTFTWTAAVPGIEASLPVHVSLRDAAGDVLEERFTTTGSGTLTVPLNAVMPVTLSATELISGKTAGEHASNSRRRPIQTLFGPRLRDLAVSRDGSTALINAFEWGQNLHALDLATGKLRWSGNVGDHFAYAPVASGDGFSVQGYDLRSGEGYHLYRVEADGKTTRRFAVPGVPARSTHWAFPANMLRRLNKSAVAADGSWIAAAGNLGLAVWSADGTLLWSQDWSRTNRHLMPLLAADNTTLVTGQVMKLAAFDPRTGKPRWELDLGPGGAILELSASADGQTIAAHTTVDSGRVFVVRAGKVVGILPTAADGMAVTPDGGHVAVTTGDRLKWYSAAGELKWTFSGDGTLRFPRMSPDGNQLLVSSEMGTVYRVDVVRGTTTQQDVGAIASSAWLPGGDMVLATWQGTVCRLAPDGTERWRVKINPATQVEAASQAAAPTSRLASYLNSEAKPLPLTPNIISPDAVSIVARTGDKSLPLQNPAALLFDGQASAADKPWLNWEDIGMIDSGWRGSFSLEIALVRRLARIKAITFVEDADHPESWLRDAKLEYWDATDGKWVFSQYLTSDAAIHTHTLRQPLEAVRFRLTRPDAEGWMESNLRLAEIVFHGDDMGSVWPSAVRDKQAVAVLFDDNLADLKPTFQHVHNPGYRPANAADAYSGAAYFIFDPAKNLDGLTVCRPSQPIESWLYPVAEHPEPGQYRWLQMAVKRRSPELKELTLWLGHPDTNRSTTIPLGGSDDWQLVRVDLWELAKKPLNLTQFWLGFNSGAGAVDQMVLARTEADLEAVKPVEVKPAGRKK